MTRDRGTHATKKLLVPLDGTAFSRQIIDQVRELFSPDRFQIAILHVAQPPASYSPPYQPGVVGPNYTLYAYDVQRPSIAEADMESRQRHALYEGDADAEYRERLEQDLVRELSAFRDGGYRATATVVFGDPVQEIVDRADDDAVAAIAMATHGRTGLSRMLQGSVAQDVFGRLKRAVPVLLLRPDGETTEGASASSAAGEAAPRAATAEGEGEAMLGNLRGTGRFVVHRHPDGKLDEATGWFVPHDASADLSALGEAQRENLPVDYDGPIADPGQDREHVRMTRVFITKIAESPERAGVEEPTSGPRVEFGAGDVVDGELSTQRSRLGDRGAGTER